MNNIIMIDLLEKISKIIELLDIKSEKDDLVKNLIGSFLLNFSRMMATDEKVAPLLKEFSEQKENKEPEKLFEFLDSKNVDYQQFAKKASDETLNNFVTNLESILDSVKIEELKKIVNK